MNLFFEPRIPCAKCGDIWPFTSLNYQLTCYKCRFIAHFKQEAENGETIGAVGMNTLQRTGMTSLQVAEEIHEGIVSDSPGSGPVQKE